MGDGVEGSLNINESSPQTCIPYFTVNKININDFTS